MSGQRLENSLSHTSHLSRHQVAKSTRPTQPIRATSTASPCHGVALLPVAALMCALSINTWAQTAPATAAAAETTDSKTLKTVTVKEKVAGPIGEALIMTALGLAVAIPAVLGYNTLVRGNKSILGKLASFAHDLHAHFVTGARVQQPRAAATVVAMKKA